MAKVIRGCSLSDSHNKDDKIALSRKHIIKEEIIRRLNVNQISLFF